MQRLIDRDVPLIISIRNGDDVFAMPLEITFSKDAERKCLLGVFDAKLGYNVLIPFADITGFSHAKKGDSGWIRSASILYNRPKPKPITLKGERDFVSGRTKY